MFLRILTASAITLFFIAQAAWADEETEALRRQIKVLEARLDALERRQAQQQQQPAQAQSAPAPAAASPPLEQRVNALEQKQQALSAEAADQAAKTATVEYGNGHGLTVTSLDRQFQLRMSGYVQADDRTFLDNSPGVTGNVDQALIRSARPVIEAKFFDNFSSRLMMDFGSGQATLLDAYADYNANNAFNIRGGKFKDPLGIERWQQEQYVLFVERGLTANLVPYRDIGMQFYGDLVPKTLEYQMALTDGAADFTNITGATDDPKTVTGRIFAHPFHNAGADALQGIGVGVAGSYGLHNASTANTDLTAGYVTPAQAKFFTYLPAAFADGEQKRFNPQATYYYGSFSAIGEYVMDVQDVRAGAKEAKLHSSAWEAIITYVLTGEDARFDGVIPRNNFDASKGTWGAFEVVARVSELHVDDAAFPTFADITKSAREARESTAGGTWYLNPSVKLNLDFALTRFTGGAPTGDREAERAILTRAQFRF